MRQSLFGTIVGSIILLGVTLALFASHPEIAGAIALVACGIVVVRYLTNEQARRAKKAAQQLANERQIRSVCNKSIAAFESIPRDLMTAEELLDVAESDFQDSAFAPFWDSIEQAMRKLGAVDGNIKLIADCSNQYKVLTRSYDGPPPPFPVDPDSVNRLATANGTVWRLKEIVRKAQRNYQFASIYEQRKTNDILIAGFTNLGEAIQGVGSRLEQSMGILGEQLNDLSSSMAVMNKKVVGAIKDADATVQTTMADQAARQEKANKMLDNIQRHRTPPPFADH